jgi:tripartite-type tricarboxylate transporter receptor subunit TctC
VRHRFLAFVAAAGFAAASFAQSYPSKPVRMINPFPAGGPVDVSGRPVLEKLRQDLGQPFLMENRPGGGTIIASELVAKAPADGYTLLFTAAQFAINPSIYKALPYDTVKDFQPVSLVAQGPFVMVVHPSVPAKNLAELIALAKQQPGKLNYASAGSGSLFHMAGELFKLAAGVNLVHVPYKGGAPATTSVLAGETQIMFGSPAGVLQHVSSGRMRLLAVTSPERSPFAPGAPTAIEAGLAGYEVDTWYGILAPAGTPREIVERLSQKIDAIVKSPEVRELYARQGLSPAGGPPEAFARKIAADMAKWGKVAKESGAKVD